MIAVLIILAVMSVPLSAVISRAYLRAKEIDAKGGGADVRQELATLREEHRLLQARVEVLETIATEGGDLSTAKERVDALHELEAAAKRSR